MLDCQRRCSQEAARLHRQLETLNTIKFDTVIVVSDQAIALWSRFNKCDARHEHSLEVYVQLYDIIINLLESAIATYASSAQKVDSQETVSSSLKGELFPNSTLGFRYLGGRFQRQITKYRDSPATGIVCMSATMCFGSHKLDGIESSILALSLIEAKLKSLALIFSQMRHRQDQSERNEYRTTKNLFRRVLGLLHEVQEEVASFC